MKSVTQRTCVVDDEGQEYDVRYRTTRWRESSEHFGQVMQHDCIEVDILDDGGCTDIAWLQECLEDIERGW